MPQRCPSIRNFLCSTVCSACLCLTLWYIHLCLTELVQSRSEGLLLGLFRRATFFFFFARTAQQAGGKGKGPVVLMLFQSLPQQKAEARDGLERFAMTPSEHLYLNVSEIISILLMRKTNLPSPPLPNKLFCIGFYHLQQMKMYPINIYIMVKLLSPGIKKVIHYLAI